MEGDWKLITENRIKSPGRAYEVLVGKALKALLRGKETRFDGTLRRNVVLPGASGAAHEIDLVLDAPLAGRTWHVDVECKDHARPVEKETAAGFGRFFSM